MYYAMAFALSGTVSGERRALFEQAKKHLDVFEAAGRSMLSAVASSV